LSPFGLQDMDAEEEYSDEYWCQYEKHKVCWCQYIHQCQAGQFPNVADSW
jgi:hypothetical protein